MGVQFRFGLLCCLILVIAVFFTGCTSNDTSDAVVTTAPTTAPVAKYTSGDIIARTASGGESQLYIITKYDAAKDEYERAWIYRNTDGTWGHFIDSRTDRSTRAIIEKVYPVMVAHVTLAAIPVIAPTYTQAAPEPTGEAPVVSAISPMTGTKDAPVTVTITGTNFQTGATARLIRPGSTPLTASAVSVTPTRIDCSFSLSVKETGSYNVVVTNPDGQSGTLQRAFTIGDAAPIITGVIPSSLEINEQAGLAINGQNFKEGVKVVLVRGSVEIPCVSPVSSYHSTITCDLDLNAVRNKDVAVGEYDVKVINIEGSQAGTWTKKFVIRNSSATGSS